MSEELKKGIDGIIFLIEHNPRFYSINRDKEIIKRLNKLLEILKGE